MGATELVTVTLDGVKYQIQPGRYSIKQFEAAIQQKKAIASLTITTPAPTQATTINGNDSFMVQGSEVFTSTAGK